MGINVRQGDIILVEEGPTKLWTLGMRDIIGSGRRLHKVLLDLKTDISSIFSLYPEDVLWVAPRVGESIEITSQGMIGTTSPGGTVKTITRTGQIFYLDDVYFDRGRSRIIGRSGMEYLSLFDFNNLSGDNNRNYYRIASTSLSTAIPVNDIPSTPFEYIPQVGDIVKDVRIPSEVRRDGYFRIHNITPEATDRSLGKDGNHYICYLVNDSTRLNKVIYYNTEIYLVNRGSMNTQTETNSKYKDTQSVKIELKDIGDEPISYTTSVSILKTKKINI